MSKYNVSNLRIDPKVFQHPADKLITGKIKSSGAFAKMLEFISKNSLERTLYSMYLASEAHITESNAPDLIAMCREAAEMFGCPKAPELFLTRSYDMFARIQGLETPVILLSTEMVNNLSDEACFGAIASCVSGMMTGYSEISMIRWLLERVGWMLPAGTADTLNALIDQWTKVAQYSFDRATLLATGDLNKAMECILGGEMPPDVLRSIDFTDPNCGYMQQCRDFLDNQGKVMGLLRSAEAIMGKGAMYASRYIELFNFYQNEYEDLVEEYEL